jgi:hypothetical protein
VRKKQILDTGCWILDKGKVPGSTIKYSASSIGTTKNGDPEQSGSPFDFAEEGCAAYYVFAAALFTSLDRREILRAVVLR